MKYIFMLLMLLPIVGCNNVPLKPNVPVTPSPTPVATTVAPVKLSWEKYPENKAWSDYVYNMILNELLPQFDAAGDASRFCGAYAKLNPIYKAAVWSELVSAVASFESGWSPTSRMVETSMGIDPITGMQVASEGLLQLSYQDVRNYSDIKQCQRIDYKLDKILDAKNKKDPNKTILNAYTNLDCGVRIMAKLIARDRIVQSPSNKGASAYWSVLRDSHNHIKTIQAMTNKFDFCTKASL